MMNHKKVIDFITSAFDDYTAGRFLLINNYHLNGVILSSMAIEKYLKAFLLRTGRNNHRVHLDNLDKLREAFDGTEYLELFNYIDPSFLQLLSLGYRFRYYDNIKETQTFGFATNHVLAALDTTINIFEYLISDIEINGEKFKTIYKRAVDAKDIKVYDKNYILNKWDKKQFCEEECQVFGLHIDPDKSGPISLIGHRVKMPLNDNKIRLVEMVYEEQK